LPSWLADELAAHVEAHVPGDDPEAWLFPSPEGGPLHRTNWTRRFWHPALTAAKAEGIRFHDLRHHAASVLIAKDVHPKIISERLGHSDIMITMNRYGHLMAGVEEKAAEALEDARPKLKAV
jgi:integrase